MSTYKPKSKDRPIDHFMPTLYVVTSFAFVAFATMAIIAIKTDTLSDRFYFSCDSLIKICVGAIIGVLSNAAMSLRQNSMKRISSQSDRYLDGTSDLPE